MDRMASSMKQVPNPLPKVLSRRGVGAGLEAAERESFERTQTVSINKAINTQEVAVKEKHARNILLDVAWKTDPEAGQLVGTEVRARLPCSAPGRGSPAQARSLQLLMTAASQRWLQRPQTFRVADTKEAVELRPFNLPKILLLSLKT
ncbi:huntingtin-interacting protein 1-like [Papio anubis]|uniref:huntingtin-interacting protein 1-like n=1 Tax=Papio anubis TaxID=9555 RepID=UPI0012AD2169|nr:huntingtin-interacting protein 1-like [Papio anubis]